MSLLIWGWDTPNTQPVRVLVDSLGRLQVDTLTSALPTGAATSANQATIIGHVDGIEALLAGGLPAALDGLSLKVKEQSPIVGFATSANQVLIDANLATLVAEQGRCYGWDGAAWQKLLVESAANPNLRVKLYDGARGASILPNAVGMAADKNALATVACVHGVEGASWSYVHAESAGVDGRSNSSRGLDVYAFLRGYNGATWDRLRTYGVGILKVGRAAVGLLTVRKTAVGQVGAAGARKLYWINGNPSAGSSLFELTDAIAAGGAVVLDHFDTTRDGHVMTYDPPMEFATGIYLETFTNITALTFGYL